MLSTNRILFFFFHFLNTIKSLGSNGDLWWNRDYSILPKVSETKHFYQNALTLKGLRPRTSLVHGRARIPRREVKIVVEARWLMLNELEEERRSDNDDEESSVTRVTIRIYEVFLSFFESFFFSLSLRLLHPTPLPLPLRLRLRTDRKSESIFLRLGSDSKRLFLDSRNISHYLRVALGLKVEESGKS